MKTSLVLGLVLVSSLLSACAPATAVPTASTTGAGTAYPLATASLPTPPSTAEAADLAPLPAGWQTYSNPLGFSIDYPSNWTEEQQPQQPGETITTVTLQGPEGTVDLHWGVGFGGACPEGYTTVKAAQGDLSTCYVKKADGTEAWNQIGKQLPTTSFSADARTSDAAPASHDLVLQIIGTLTFAP